ncbi:helix-turn-helix domain-containing protein [Spirosoma endbachense]|uniref:Helix-turn-helix domain-containing protein n=1 Tax=Spirosoma endbachense TaxID=2666025 RepID=A0A6P1VSM9_9BACT|nr:helix-turn-helix domain-containing protein [Spirosoma endbachense]QHV95695.1 helix-turn-helix domain-containing protein [Spirosoma endbachense]
MICKRIKPASFVGNYVKEYLLLHMAFDPTVAAPVKAYPTNPEEGITFQILGNLFAESPELKSGNKPAKTYVFGQPDSRQNFHLPHEFKMVHVRFQPGGLFHLARIPMNELVHQQIDAEVIFGSAIKEVNDRLANAPDYESIPPILDTFFARKIAQIKHTSRPIDQIGRLILANPQRFNLAWVADQACLSVRQFENLFVRQIGITPKYYARICRFYQAYELKEFYPDLDWLSVAIQTGYTDYQHLVKDFKQFAGTAPNALIRESNQNPERRLKIADTFHFRGV